MPATTDHKCFIQPQNENIKLWRYMDFTKFVSLISSNSLFFCRSYLFEDPFEGSYPKLNIKHRLYVYEELRDSMKDDVKFEKILSQKRTYTRLFRHWTYINCWHANEYESAAMWSLYYKTNESIAIETDYISLKNVLSEDIFLGIVNYIDYEKIWLSEDNMLLPFMYKRKSFEHEKEVRAIHRNQPSSVFFDSFEKDYDSIEKNSSSGIAIKININQLIKKIHVAPTAPSWLVSLTIEIAKKYGISAPVKKSDLYSEPIF